MAAIVLLHGAYQGGWIWQRVAPHLRAAGHTVYAPTLDGCGERKHLLRPGIDTESQAAEVAEMLFYEDLRDVVLVGTSCGGMIACRVAEVARERIGRVVLADALALMKQHGISGIPVVERGPSGKPAKLVGILTKQIRAFEGTVSGTFHEKRLTRAQRTGKLFSKLRIGTPGFCRSIRCNELFEPV